MHDFENPGAAFLTDAPLVFIAPRFIEISDTDPFRIDVEVLDARLFFGFPAERVFFGLPGLHVTLGKVEMPTRILEDEILTRPIRHDTKQYAANRNFPDNWEAEQAKRVTEYFVYG